uniref:Uncharacterized protein n=1 Tax=Tetranychus urticae TaxID=32264 RepID=T1K9Z1_TETUR
MKQKEIIISTKDVLTTEVCFNLAGSCDPIYFLICSLCLTNYVINFEHIDYFLNSTSYKTITIEDIQAYRLFVELLLLFNVILIVISVLMIRAIKRHLKK